jgi:Glycosyltransferase family 87
MIHAQAGWRGPSSASPATCESHAGLGAIPVPHNTGMAATVRRISTAWGQWRVDGRFALVAFGLVLAVAFVGVYPMLSTPQTQDWLTYRAAGEHLLSGGPLYVVDGALVYAYPPPTAVVWAWGMTDGLWLVLKLLALASLALLFPFRLGVAIAVLAFVTLPVQDDLILGNVMTFFLVGVMWSIFGRGWRAALPLGIVLAFAIKPAIGPLLVWMVIRDRSKLVRIAAVALATTGVFAILAGPSRYLEYLASLPMTTSFIQAWAGNVGLNAVLPILWPAGIALGYVLTLAAAIRLDARRSCAVALAMTLLAQPSLAYPYAVFLIPAVLLLWDVDRRRALLAGVVLPMSTLVMLPASAILAWLAAQRPWARAEGLARIDRPEPGVSHLD